MTNVPSSGGQFFNYDTYLEFLKKQVRDAQENAMRTATPKAPALAGLQSSVQGSGQ